MHSITSDSFDVVPLADLAVRWRCSVSSVRRKIAKGLLPVVILPGSTKPLVPLAAIRQAETPRIVTRAAEANQ